MENKMKFLFIFIIITVAMVGVSIFILKNWDERGFEEPTIDIKLANKKITANTNSYCDRKVCVSKKAPYEMDYEEVLHVGVGEKIKIERLNDSINKVELLINSNEIIDVVYSDEDKTIEVPDVVGEYVIVVRSLYNYSFKVNVFQVDNEYKELISSIDKFVSKDYLGGYRLLRVLEYGYYPSKKNERYIQVDFYVDNEGECSKFIKYNNKSGELTVLEDSSFNSLVVQTGKIMYDVK